MRSCAVALSILISSGSVLAQSPERAHALTVFLPAAKELKFVAFGDAGSGMPVQYQVAGAMAQVCRVRGCDFAVELGDNFYPSGVSNVLDPQFQEKFEKPYAVLDFPIFVVLGNHDTGVNGSGRNNKFGDVQVEYSRSGISKKFRMPGRYYRITVPNTRGRDPFAELYALDSNPETMVGPDVDGFDAGAYALKQLEWLRGELSNSKARWKIAFAHHPYISNGVAGDAGRYARDPEHSIRLASGWLWKQFLDRSVCQYGVDLYLQGHDHDMEWLKPIKSCGRTHFITSGAGGAGPGPFNHPNHPVFWQKTKTHGFFWLKITRKEMTVAAYTLEEPLQQLPVDDQGRPQAEFERSVARTPAQSAPQ